MTDKSDPLLIFTLADLHIREMPALERVKIVTRIQKKALDLSERMLESINEQTFSPAAFAVALAAVANTYIRNNPAPPGTEIKIREIWMRCFANGIDHALRNPVRAEDKDKDTTP